MTERLFVAILILLAFQGCAKVGKPSGGPQDLHPPQYVSGIPENRSVNFKNDRIDLLFDEYIQLKDQQKEVLISPPMKEKPLIRVREKTIRVTLDEELLPETTYTLNFGNSITDLNEGNLLPDFEYVFSTGDVIDSLSITGEVASAFDHKPETETGMLVMLYENLSDSAPLLEKPCYYGRANKDGLFAVNNIHPDTFNVIGLKDRNNNLQYDRGIEEVAFLDTFLIINTDNVIPQTFIKDTVKIITPAREKGKIGGKGKEPAVADTVIAPGKLLNALNVCLSYFLEENDKVFITSRNRDNAECFSFGFNRSLYDSLRIVPLNFTSDDTWFQKEISADNDSVVYWITDTSIIKLDTLKLNLFYSTVDSMGMLTMRSDTIVLRYQQASKQKGRRGSERRGRNEDKKEEGRGAPPEKPNVPDNDRGDQPRGKKDSADEAETFLLKTSIQNRGIIDLNKPITITTGRPLRTVNPDSIELYKQIDTIYVKRSFTCEKDTTSLRTANLITEWEEDMPYRLLLKPGAVTDIYGSTNDSAEIKFSTQKADYYGKIVLTFNSSQFPMIVQVLNAKEQVIKSEKVFDSGLISFDFLPPGTYKLKAILDRNNNGKWDTGHYLKHRQPEKTFLANTVVQLRSNWDYELTWDITE